MVVYIANGVPIGLVRLLVWAMVFYSILARIVLKTPRGEIQAWLVF